MAGVAVLRSALGQEIEHVPRRRGDMLHAGRRVRASSPCRSMNAAAARYAICRRRRSPSRSKRRRRRNDGRRLYRWDRRVLVGLVGRLAVGLAHRLGRRVRRRLRNLGEAFHRVSISHWPRPFSEDVRPVPEQAASANGKQAPSKVRIVRRASFSPPTRCFSHNRRAVGAPRWSVGSGRGRLF